MRLDWATLANAAETSGGLLNLLGAGWDTGTRAAFPAPFAGTLAIRLVFHRRELARPHRLVVEVVTEDGRRLVEIAHEFMAASPQGSPIPDEVPIPIALNLSQLQIDAPGRYAIEVFLDDQHLKTLPVVFQLPPAPS
jgi:hypothetical protein